MRIVFQQGDLLKCVDEDAIIVHACNCRGVWGSGFAKDLKPLYPEAFAEYKNACDTYGKKLLGTSFLAGQNIFCLFTSDGYGYELDGKKDILKNTKLAIKDMMYSVSYYELKKEIHSPKINAGRFKIPWEETEQIISDALDYRTDVNWVVWYL